MVSNEAQRLIALLERDDERKQLKAEIDAGDGELFSLEAGCSAAAGKHNRAIILALVHPGDGSTDAVMDSFFGSIAMTENLVRTMITRSGGRLGVLSCMLIVDQLVRSIERIRESLREAV